MAIDVSPLMPDVDFPALIHERGEDHGGIVRPSTSAVFMSTTGSNLVGCWTGRSAPGERQLGGRTFPLRAEGWNVGNRRVSPIAAPSGDGLLSEQKAGTEPQRREPLFVPRSRHP